MAGTSASHIIWFIAAVLAATALSGVMVTTVFQMADNMEERGRALSDELSCAISIENDVTMVPYNNTTFELTIYLKNIGSKEIYYEGSNYTFLLLVTGGNLTGSSDFLPGNMTVLGTGDSFLPGRTIRLTYDIETLYTDYQYRMKVIASDYSDVGDSTDFRITYV